MINNNLLTAGLKPNVQYVLDAETLQRVVKAVVSEAIEEAKDKDGLLSVRQVCEMLRVSRSTLRRWEKAGCLRPVRFGCKVRYRENDVLKMGE